ncbi:MAG: stage II sporulation protein M, partial [Treponema sp.]|nr:stage II sporulation protein M [Treponema sp.]
MTERAFVRRRGAFWTDFELLVNGSRKEIRLHAADFPRRFREITQDLNIARAHGFDPAVIEKLNRLVLEGNQILYGQHEWPLKNAAEFILRTFPRKVRARWRGLGAMLLLFYGLAFFFGFLCVRFPELVYELMSESEASMLEEMYDPSNEHFLVPRDVGSDADMFGYYIYNNISIAFRIFAGGILAGAGSLLLLCVNAVFMGTAAGHIINNGFGGTFFPFIVAHSSFELTAILL